MLDLKKLKNNLEDWKRQESYASNVQLALLKIENNIAILHTVESELEVQKSLFELVFKNFNTEKKVSKEIMDYDPVVLKDNSLFSMNISQSPFIGIKNINVFDDWDISVPSNYKETDYLSYVIKLRGLMAGEDVFFVGKFQGIGKIQQRKYMFYGNLSEDRLKKFEEDNIFGLNSDLEFLVYRDIVIGQRKPVFEKIFGFQDIFSEKAEEAIDVIKTFNRIQNIDNLKEKAKRDTRISRRLTKIVARRDRMEAFFNNAEKINEVLTSENLKHKFNEVQLDPNTGEIIYTDKSAHQVLTLIADTAYKAIVSGFEDIDGSR